MTAQTLLFYGLLRGVRKLSSWRHTATHHFGMFGVLKFNFPHDATAAIIGFYECLRFF